ncbi:hypothetical protein MFLO_11270 [Listeria floridensis FSL S10-1187]|uniref:Oxidoreductase n=1 Tax=Listeria floridensis FSL S10-1187 TaxID=1265817 RepID=A0ABP3AWC1_9LIST|nr:hypothetical protein MFLO_11270 [Listeria floridensis FSL S10-1187]
MGTIILEYGDFNVTIIQGKTSSSFLESEIYGEKGTLVIDPLTSIENLTFRGNHGEEKIELAEPIISNDMQFEAARFAEIIASNDTDGYTELAELGIKVLRLSNELRHQNGIYFDSEK